MRSLDSRNRDSMDVYLAGVLKAWVKHSSPPPMGRDLLLRRAVELARAPDGLLLFMARLLKSLAWFLLELPFGFMMQSGLVDDAAAGDRPGCEAIESRAGAMRVSFLQMYAPGLGMFNILL